MNGPAVNWALFNKLQETMIKEHNTRLLDIGSCGLHTLHNGFLDGAESTGWDIGSTLGALYWLFNDDGQCIGCIFLNKNIFYLITRELTWSSVTYGRLSNMYSSLKQDHSFNFSNMESPGNLTNSPGKIPEKAWNFISQDVWEPCFCMFWGCSVPCYHVWCP